MKFPILALYERALRVETRSIAMAFARMALPGMVLVSLVPIALMARFGQLGAPGLRFFQSTVWMDFFFVTLAGLSYFASAVAEEKEEMTLGLLRMTGLSPLALLLGKSASRLTGAMLLLGVQVPFTLLAVTLGGIGNQQIAAAYCILLAYTFFLCNLALVWSVACRHTAMAAFVTGASLIAFYALPPALAALMADTAATSGSHAMRAFAAPTLVFCNAWAGIVPFQSLNRIFSTGASFSPIDAAVIAHVVLGVLLFLLAWAIFDRCTRQEKQQVPSRGFAFRRRGPGARVPAAVVGGRAITWKEFRIGAGGWPGLTAKLAIFGLIGAAVACSPLISDTKPTRTYVGNSLMIVSTLLAALSLAFDSARVFRDEVRWKTLSGLAMLPISVRELVLRKIVGCAAGILPALPVFLVGFAVHPDSFIEGLADVLSGGRSLIFGAMAILQFILFLHLTAFLSLLIKRGALPLAFVIQYVTLTFGSAFLSMGFAMGLRTIWLPTIAGMAITCVLIWLLHHLIGERLRHAAAEE